MCRMGKLHSVAGPTVVFTRVLKLSTAVTRCFVTNVAAGCTERLVLDPGAGWVGGWAVAGAVWHICFFHAANYLDQ